MVLTPELLDAQVAEYRRVQALYEQIAAVARANLERLAARYIRNATVATRAKTVPSFAEKLQRKQKYREPLKEVTDLCGARIVCEFESDVQTVCLVVRRRFDKAIDVVNSLDQRSILRAGEFGYRAVHYVVELQSNAWDGLSPDMEGKKIEIQVCTRLQNIWSELGHDRVYKGAYPLPDAIKREVARIAAQFESLDEEFERLIAGIADYRSHYGAYLNETGLKQEHALQAALRRHDPDNSLIPLKQAEMAIAADDWGGAIEQVRSFQRQGGTMTPDLWSVLGYALCQLDPLNRRRPEFDEGIRLMRQGAAGKPTSVMPWVRLAACVTETSERLECYRQAYRADPGDPMALFGLLEAQLQPPARNLQIVDLVRPAIRDAIERCQRQIQCNIDTPWAHFRAGWFSLLLADSQDDERAAAEDRTPASDPFFRKDSRLNVALGHYLLGIAITRHSSDSTPIRSALSAVRTLREADGSRTDVQIVWLLLQLVLELRHGDAELPQRLAHLASSEQRRANASGPPPPPRVCLVAGSAKPATDEPFSAYRSILVQALSDFEGTVISGGTEQGVPGLVGEIGAASGGRIRTVGYLPAGFASTMTSKRDDRYSEFRRTQGERFSPLEPLQSWIDLIVSGVRPASVTMLGFGGGRIAAFEYRLALILGARVGVMADSGRESELLARDPEWDDPRWRLRRIPLVAADAAMLRAFMQPPTPRTELEVDKLARLSHDAYVAAHRDKLIPAWLRDWDQLPADLQRSNREQVMAAPDLLATEGYRVVPLAPGTSPARPAYLDDEAQRERLAALEHGRWVEGKLASGWRYEPGKPRDNVKKLHPDLVSWSLLAPESRQEDYRIIDAYPALLAASGLTIAPSSPTP